MIPNGIKQRFELYQKWFKTFLIKEFLNLPTKYQERLLMLINSFTEDCKKLYEEGKLIKEKVVKIKVIEILSLDNKEENYIVIGKSTDVKEPIRIVFPMNMSKPKVGDRLYHTVFSIDEEIWYSTKEELIKRGQ